MLHPFPAKIGTKSLHLTRMMICVILLRQANIMTREGGLYHEFGFHSDKIAGRRLEDVS